MKKIIKNIKYPLAIDTITKRDKKQLTKFIVLNSQLTQNKYVESMEKKFADYHKSKYCTMVNSGSSANLIMFSSLFHLKQNPLKKGDEIIVPSLGWSTSYSPIIQLGLIPVFIDIKIDTFNINEEEIEKNITKKTRAILVINILGNPSNYDAILRISKKYNLILLEDNCESLGSKYKNKLTGTFGMISTGSSYFSHHISTIEGGYVLTNSRYIDSINKSLRSHGWLRDKSSKFIYNKKINNFYKNFTFILPGYNLRSTEINAYLGLLQMKRLDNYLKIRRQNYIFIKNIIENTQNFKLQNETYSSSWFGFGIVYTKYNFRNFKKIIQILNRNKFEIRPIVSGDFTKQPMIKSIKFKKGKLKNVEIIDKFGFMIGNNPFLLTSILKIKIKEVFKIIDNI